MNLRFKWVGRWSPEEKQRRLFRVMWERGEWGQGGYSAKLAVSIKRFLPRVTLRKSFGGRFV